MPVYLRAMQQLTPIQLQEWLTNHKDFLLIDIREQWERDGFNIGGLHIPMDQLFSRRGELPAGTPIVLYCEKGIRSTIAIQRLEASGFPELYNLSGGMSAWKTAGLPAR